MQQQTASSKLFEQQLPRGRTTTRGKGASAGADGKRRRDADASSRSLGHCVEHEATCGEGTRQSETDVCQPPPGRRSTAAHAGPPRNAKGRRCSVFASSSSTGCCRRSDHARNRSAPASTGPGTVSAGQSCSFCQSSTWLGSCCSTATAAAAGRAPPAATAAAAATAADAEYAAITEQLGRWRENTSGSEGPIQQIVLHAQLCRNRKSRFCVAPFLPALPVNTLLCVHVCGSSASFTRATGGSAVINVYQSMGKKCIGEGYFEEAARLSYGTE